MEFRFDNYILKAFLASGLLSLVMMVLALGLIQLFRYGPVAASIHNSHHGGDSFRPFRILLRALRGGLHHVVDAGLAHRHADADASVRRHNLLA